MDQTVRVEVELAGKGDEAVALRLAMDGKVDEVPVSMVGVVGGYIEAEEVGRVELAVDSCILDSFADTEVGVVYIVVGLEAYTSMVPRVVVVEVVENVEDIDPVRGLVEHWQSIHNWHMDWQQMVPVLAALAGLLGDMPAVLETDRQLQTIE